MNQTTRNNNRWRVSSPMGRTVFVFFILFLLHAKANAGNGVADLQRFYQQAKSFSADFNQVVLDAGLNTIEESNGRMWIARPGRFRWNYQPPLAQEIVSNSERVWVYDPDLEQVTIRPIDGLLGETPALLLAGNGKLDDRYVVEDLGNLGALSWVVLKSRNADAGFEDIRIGFENRELRVIELVDGLGQMTRITLSNVEENPILADDVFEFPIPDGVDIIDETDRLY